MGRFTEYVERLHEELGKRENPVITVAEVSVLLGVSPNYAREIMKAYAILHKDEVVYTSGRLIKLTKAEAGAGEAGGA